MAPTYPGEHPTLPRLDIDLIAASPERHRGKIVIEARPASVRLLLSPVNNLQTANPARLRRIALDILHAATALELEHHRAAKPKDPDAHLRR